VGFLLAAGLLTARLAKALTGLAPGGKLLSPTVKGSSSNQRSASSLGIEGIALGFLLAFGSSF
jgi:hypothetical protein